MPGYSVSRAYDNETADSDCSEDLASDSNAEMNTDQRACRGVVPLSKPSDKCPHVESPKSRVPRGLSGTPPRNLNAKTSRPPRPLELQHSNPVSAPNILQHLATDHTATAEYRTPRSVSRGHSAAHSKAPDQSPRSLQRTRKSESSLLSTTPSKKRRRSDQDTAQMNDIVSQGSPLTGLALSHTQSVRPGSSSPSRDLPRCGKLEDTSKGSASGTESHLSDDDDQPSFTSSERSVEDPPGSHVLGLRSTISASSPPFEAYHKGRIPITRVTHKVFDTMQTVLSGKKDSDDGHIYTLRLAERPGFVKIGRTKNPIDKRKSQISRCITYSLEVINDDDYCPVENHTRVERLIHEELRNYRQSFRCACKQSKPHSDPSDGMTTHGEWFAIDEAKAVEVVTRWRKWMSTKPYRDGSLKLREKQRINVYRKDSNRMNAMVVGQDDDWRWHIFMRHTPWQLRLLWLYANLFEERYERPTCSPWDSLWKHWKSNVLFGLVFFLLSCFLFALSEFLLLSFEFAPSPALLNTLVLGSGAILYAA